MSKADPFRRNLLVRTLVSTIALTSALAAAPAAAALVPEASAIMIRACAGRGGQIIDRTRLAEALLAETQRLPSEFLVQAPSQAQVSYGDSLVQALGDVQRAAGSSPRDPEYIIIGAIDVLEMALADSVGSATSPLRLSQAPGPSPWLFQQTATPPWTLHCRAVPRRTMIQEVEDTPGPRRFLIRAKPEELPLVGQAARAAGGFAVGFERSRDATEGGGTRTDTTASINGTIGLRLSNRRAASPSFAYARYSLQRARTEPAPTLPPNTSQSDGDTNSLEAGVNLSSEFTRNESEFKLFNNTSLSTVFDFAGDRTGLRLRSTFQPAHPDARFGVCRLGSFEPLAGGDVFGRCSLQAEIEAARVFDRGPDDPVTDSDTFLAIGVRGQIEFFIPTAATPGTGFLSSVSYRWMPVLHGRLDNISRLDAQVKHRFWMPAGAGLDIGFSFVRGRNELSYEREDILRFGVGIVF